MFPGVDHLNRVGMSSGLMNYSVERLKRLKRRIYAWKHKRSIDSLIEHESRQLSSIGNALRDAAVCRVSSDESQIISLIEGRRSDLLVSEGWWGWLTMEEATGIRAERRRR